MTAAALIAYMTAIAVSCLALGLDIASAIRSQRNWNTWCIVFQSCLLFSMVLGFMLSFSQLVIPPRTDAVLRVIFRILQHMAIGFVAVVLPFLSNVIVGVKWSGLSRLVFYPLGIIYLAVGIVGEFADIEVVLNIVQTSIFTGVLIYCVVVLWKNLGRIKDSPTRGFLLGTIIVVVSLIPSEVLLFLFPQISVLAYPLYVLATSILLIVFFSTRLKYERNGEGSTRGLSEADLAKLGITERESEVIACICRGMTNKEIGWELKISVNTVNNHVANIFEKMNISSRIELLRRVNGNLWS